MRFSKITVNVNEAEVVQIVTEHVRRTHGLDSGAELEVKFDRPLTLQNNRVVLDRPLPSDAVRELINGNKIGAIKELLMQWNLGLKDAKDYVELYDYVVRGGPKPF